MEKKPNKSINFLILAWGNFYWLGVKSTTQVRCLKNDDGNRLLIPIF